MNPVDESHDENSRPFLVRLVHTPLPDLLRGRVTGRYDVKGLLMRSGLPRFLQDYAFKVVLRTGLWRSEKIVVAQELADRLKEELAAARSVLELIDGLEPWKKAGSRIGAEKWRARRLMWRALERTALIAAAISVVLSLSYLACSIRFMAGEPNIAWNPLAEFNAKAKAVPEDERAWPIYRRAISKLKPIPEGLTGVEPSSDSERVEPLSDYRFLHTIPDEEHWDALLDYTAEVDEALGLARQAAKKSKLGFFFGDPADRVVPPVDFAGRGKDVPLALPPRESNPMLSGIGAPHLSQLRVFAHLFRSDALRAAKEGDGDRVVADFDALIGIFRQYGNSRMNASELAFACDTLGIVLSEQPECLKDEHLEELATILDAVTDAEFFHIRFDWERADVRDRIQRMYTDNGQGGGHLTRHMSSVLWCFAHLQEPPLWEKRLDSLPGYLFFPVPILDVGRQQTSWFCSEIIDEAERQGKLPLWERRESVTRQRLDAMSTIDIARYSQALWLLRTTNHAGPVVGEISRQRYDAARAAIALEQYRRNTGNWPERLDQLTSDLLPAVPPDRFDGKPIKYRLTDDRPVLYSIGVDRVDDGGTPPDDEYPCPDIWAPPSEVPRLRAESRHRGDWILWPPVRP